MASVQMASYQAAMDVRFAVAARHSRLVRFLRFAVPMVVVVSMAAIVAISIFNPFRYLSKLPLEIGDIVVSGTKITMETPHLSGFSQDGRPYELWAKTATQDLTNPNRVELQTLRAKVLTQDQSTIIMDARDGVFNTQTQLLNLRNDVYLHNSAGNEAWMTQADVDIGKGTVFSDEPVDVKWLGGKVRGQRLRITGNGELVRFEGGVVMNLDSGGPSLPQQPVGETRARTEPAKTEPARTEPGKTEPSQTKPRASSGNRAATK